MQKIKAKLPAFRRLTTREALIGAGVVVLILMIAFLCISINMRAHIQNEYASARNTFGEALYSNMYMLMQTFDMASVPNADMQNGILPQMKEYFVASNVLNDAIANAYGEKFRVISHENIASIDSAFSAYESAFLNGSSTDLAHTNMTSCMDAIRQLLSSRFSEGVLKPLR